MEPVESDRLLDTVWPPMLAQLSSVDQAQGDGFIFEVKYDGFRALAALSHGQLRLVSRNRLDLSRQFPTIAAALAELQLQDVVLDGEAAALDPSGRSSFRHLRESGANERFYIFDVLWHDGRDLRREPWTVRRERLEALIGTRSELIRLSELVPGPVEAALENARARQLEGVIAKRRDSPYSGRRSSDWLKLKLIQRQEFAIGGYVPLSTGTAGVGALLVGVYRAGQLVYAGKVGTGYSAKQREQLLARLQPEIVDRSPFADSPRMRDVFWTRPKWAAEIAFLEWTDDGRLRHPSFQGLRTDKKPEECGRESKESEAAPPRAKRMPETAVAVTHGERVLFPRSGFTKADVFRYYEAVAPLMVRALEGRPLSVQQWPKGIAEPGFFRQQLKGAPPWATTVRVEHDTRPIQHLVVDRPQTLLWLANQSALTLHAWSSRVAHLEQPDWVVFDLDPAEGQPWAHVIQVATTLRGFLEQLGLSSVPKTSGKRGIHILVPLAPGHLYPAVAEFASAIVRTLSTQLSAIATIEWSKVKRKGRLYLDAGQNGFGRTLVAPYSLRGLEGAPASMPLRWDEITEKLDPQAWNIRSVPERLAREGDLFAAALNSTQRLPRFV